MWAMIPLDEVVRESDLIIVGTLYSATEDSEGLGSGHIRVEAIIGGKAVSLDDLPLAIGDSLKIKWADNWACAAGMHIGRQDRIGVWLLDVEEDGSVSAAHPGKFESIEQLGEIIRLLRNAKAKKAVEVDVYRKQTRPAVLFTEKREVLAVDVSPPADHSLARGLITFLFATGLYWLLYRSRIRIR